MSLFPASLLHACPSLIGSVPSLRTLSPSLLLLLLYQLHFTEVCVNRPQATMIKTLTPYSNTAKTAEIMSRYRPIAPKPELPAGENTSMSHKIRQSPYLRNLWPQLQARPTRTRKRGRAPISPPPTIKRPRTHILGLSSSSHVIPSPTRRLSFQGFAHGLSRLSVPSLGLTSSLDNNSVTVTHSDLVTLSLLPCQPPVSVVCNQPTVPEIYTKKPRREMVIDLNTAAEVPEEKDLLQQLHQPPTTTNVIAPQPVRPVGSTITVGCITEDPISSTPSVQVPKKPDEVEEEVESESLPAIISDSNYRVRLANSAYKEMVGQPVCSWLDSMVIGDGRLRGKRICGEVILHLANSRVPTSSNKFFCWVNIEWGQEGKKKAVGAFCEVIRLSCQSKDYLFCWRFHTLSREGSRASANA